ncbi:MAG TPA: glycosyltransferase family 4 protein, partial [Ktedonobacterales bacterium]
MQKKCKVLMVVGNNPAPEDSRVWPEALALRDAGCQVCIISPKGETQHRESHVYLEGIHTYRFHLPAGESVIGYIIENAVVVVMTFWLSLVVLARHGFDVIHAANPPDTYFPLAALYRLLGKRFIFDQHDIAPEMFDVIVGNRASGLARQALRAVLGGLERGSYRMADVVIVANRSFATFAVERGGCRDERVVVVRNGPNLRRFTLVAPEPALKRGRRYLLGYTGVMGVQDGVDVAIRALDILVHRRGRCDVGLVLLGDGPDGARLRDLIHELHLDDYVEFTGFVSHDVVRRYLSTVDVGLCPDPQNGLNEYCTMIKTMEYMALGKPVVAFDLIETRFSAQDAALYATPNSYEDFASKIETLLADADLRKRMGEFGQQRVRNALSWQHSITELLRAYRILFPDAFPLE